MEVVAKDSAPVTEIFCPFDIQILDEGQHNHRKQEQPFSSSEESSSSSSSQSSASQIDSIPMVSASQLKPKTQTSQIPPQTPQRLHIMMPVKPPTPSSLPLESPSSSPTKFYATNSYIATHLPIPEYTDNHTIINSLKCKVFTLTQHIEELQSSEALIVGEQKIRIRKLEANEPFRVRELTEEIHSLKRSFVDLLERQVENLAEIQIDLHDLRMRSSSFSLDGTCTNLGDSFLATGEMSKNTRDEHFTAGGGCKHDCTETDGDVTMSTVRTQEATRNTQTNKEETSFDDASEMIDYVSDIRNSQKNVFILQKVLERRANALRDEVNKLLGKKHIAKSVKISRFDFGAIASVDGKDHRDFTGNLSTKRKSPSPVPASASDASHNVFSTFVNLTGNGNILSSSLATDHLDEDDYTFDDDDDDTTKPSLSDIRQLQEELVKLKRSKDSEISELRYLIAMQNMHYASRIIASHMKIDEIHSMQERAQNSTSSRLDVLERESKRLQKSLMSNDSGKGQSRPRNRRCPGRGVDIGLYEHGGGPSWDGTIHHNNGYFESQQSEKSTDEETSCVTKEESLATFGKHAAKGKGALATEIEIEPERREELDAHGRGGDDIRGMKFILAEKESRISLLEIELKEANNVIHNVAAALDKTFDPGPESRPLLTTFQGLHVHEGDHDVATSKSSSWLKKGVRVLKKKRKRNRKKDREACSIDYTTAGK